MCLHSRIVFPIGYGIKKNTVVTVTVTCKMGVTVYSRPDGAEFVYSILVFSYLTDFPAPTVSTNPGKRLVFYTGAGPLHPPLLRPHTFRRLTVLVPPTSGPVV